MFCSFFIFLSIRGYVLVCEYIFCVFKCNYFMKMKLKVYMKVKILMKNKNKIIFRNWKVIRKRRKFKKRIVVLIIFIFD